MNNKILIADDSNSWLTFHKALIEELYKGMFDITLANSAQEAYNLILHNANNPFHIIITDLQMELSYEDKTAGEWLIERIKEISKYNTTKIVIISGMYNIEQIAENYNVECISKNILIRNKLLMKFMFEKLMPYLTQI